MFAVCSAENVKVVVGAAPCKALPVPSGRVARKQRISFEPLFSEKGDGLGMGLYVARAIVEAHGGRIVLVSEGRGTEAEIHLPVTP